MNLLGGAYLRATTTKAVGCSIVAYALVACGSGTAGELNGSVGADAGGDGSPTSGGGPPGGTGGGGGPPGLGGTGPGGMGGGGPAGAAGRVGSSGSAGLGGESGMGGRAGSPGAMGGSAGIAGGAGSAGVGGSSPCSDHPIGVCAETADRCEFDPSNCLDPTPSFCSTPCLQLCQRIGETCLEAWIGGATCTKAVQVPCAQPIVAGSAICVCTR